MMSAIKHIGKVTIITFIAGTATLSIAAVVTNPAPDSKDTFSSRVNLPKMDCILAESQYSCAGAIVLTGRVMIDVFKAQVSTLE